MRLMIERTRCPDVILTMEPSGWENGLVGKRGGFVYKGNHVCLFLKTII